jgi:hypothetical protein
MRKVKASVAMNKRLTDIVQEHDGLLWQHPDRPLAVSDHFGCRLFRLPPEAELEDPESVDDTATRLGAFFASLNDRDPKPSQVFRIEILRETLMSGPCRGVIDLLVKAFHVFRVNLIVHFSEPSDDWSDILDWSETLYKELGKRGADVWITLEGPFGPVTDETKRAFLQRRLQFHFSHGLSQGTSPEGRDAGLENLDSLARFGFLIPTTHYVSGGNRVDLADAIDKDLVANFDSGFSLPIACQHPRYEPKHLNEIPLPETSDYIELLGEMLARYPHYDLVFEPLAELNSIVAEGGWNQQLGVPSRIRLTVRADGTVGVYRQVPMLAKTWKDAAAILSLDPKDLRDDLLAFCARELTPETNPTCAECHLRFMCAGMDSAGDDTDSADLEAVSELICSTRQFFLEAFLWQRVKLEEVTVKQTAEAEAVG